jgi:plasmid stabilization system protein ParE
MALSVIWSPRALENLHQVIDYLEMNWGEKVVTGFVQRIDTLIKLISERPNVFKQISEKNSVREAVITEHNLLLYRVYKNHIVLLAVFDTRQHPRKKKAR